MRGSFLVLALLVGCNSAAKHGEIRVAAASDLAYAFPEIAKLFEKKTGNKVTFTFGSSGNFAKQLAEGAPFDVYASANVKFVDDTVAAGACDGATRALYGRGRIVVWTRHGIAPAAGVADLADARFVKIAIANPQHAPYGKAAQQALESTGAWAAVQPKLVYGENIQQTLQFVQSGNVEAAVVALSLARAQATAKEGVDWALVDESQHKPLDQALVVCKKGANAAVGKQFADFVQSPEGRAVMTRFGFVLPGETPAAR
jgi:molybdate transport system substrate-binding protein